MGAVALKEREPMTHETATPKSDPQSQLDVRDDLEAAAERVAAGKAVRSIPNLVQELGGSETQAASLAEAMRLILLQHDAQACAVLSEGGFPPTVINPLVAKLREGLRPAA